MNGESETPRTDSACDAGGDVEYSFAAQLERELNEARHNLIIQKMEYEKLLGNFAVEQNKCKKLSDELIEWKNIIKDFNKSCTKKSSIIFL